MSLVVRTFQIFSGLGSVAISPFAVSFAQKHISINSGGGIKESKREIKTEEKQQQTVFQQAIEIMEGKGGGLSGEKSEKRWFWLPDSKGYELFMCAFMNQLGSPFLFHYDRSGKLKLEKKLNQITSLTYTGRDSAKMQFKDGPLVDMTPFVMLSLSWFRKWEITLIPETHCKISQEGGNRKYKLTCDAENKKVGGKLWSREVSPETPYEKGK